MPLGNCPVCSRSYIFDGDPAVASEACPWCQVPLCPAPANRRHGRRLDARRTGREPASDDTNRLTGWRTAA
jgi:hypothetical protein